MSGERLLLVDDEVNLRSMLEAALRHSGFEVHAVDSGRAALEAVGPLEPDLVVLDVMLPDVTGFNVCHRSVSRAEVPVVFLTARDGTDDKASLARPSAGTTTRPSRSAWTSWWPGSGPCCAAPGGSGPSSRLEFADLVLDEDAHRASRAGQELELTPTEFKLLRFLLLNAGRVLSKAQILDHVWRYDFGGNGEHRRGVRQLPPEERWTGPDRR